MGCEIQEEEVFQDFFGFEPFSQKDCTHLRPHFPHRYHHFSLQPICNIFLGYEGKLY